MVHRTIDARRIVVGFCAAAGLVAVAALADPPQDVNEVDARSPADSEPEITIPRAIFGFLLSYSAFRFREKIGSLIFGRVLAHRRREYQKALQKMYERE